MDSTDKDIESLSRVISASEPWADGYSDAPDQHAELIKAEAKLETKLRHYFRDLAKERVTNYISFYLYEQERVKVKANDTIKATDINVMVTETMESVETAILLSVIIDDIDVMIGIGSQAGEYIYSTPMGLNQYTESILKEARKHSITLAKGITETTRNKIRQQLESSIALGEDTPTLIKRLTDSKLINDPKRAEMIARTESVNSYSKGLLQFGNQSGAESKTWQAVMGACRVCAPVDGETVPISELFMNGKQSPAGHPRCRCTMRLNYPYEP